MTVPVKGEDLTVKDVLKWIKAEMLKVCASIYL